MSRVMLVQVSFLQMAWQAGTSSLLFLQQMLLTHITLILLPESKNAFDSVERLSGLIKRSHYAIASF